MRPVLRQVRLETRQSPLRHLLLAAGVLFVASTSVACTSPQTPQGKCSEAAREMNEAARWGRMDVALERTDPEDHGDYLRRHQLWHKKIKIYDTELVGLRLIDPTNAIVQIDVDWTLEDDTTLRSTRLEQEWSDDEGKWVLISEKRIEGAEGLFGEEIEHAEKQRDQHFPTKVIR